MRYGDVERVLVLVLRVEAGLGTLWADGLAVDEEVEWATTDDLQLAPTDTSDGAPLRARLAHPLTLRLAQLDAVYAVVTPAAMAAVEAALAGRPDLSRLGAEAPAAQDLRRLRDEALEEVLELFSSVHREVARAEALAAVPEPLAVPSGSIAAWVRQAWTSGATPAETIADTVRQWWSAASGPKIQLRTAPVRGAKIGGAFLRSTEGIPARLLLDRGELLLRVDGMDPAFDDRFLLVVLPDVLLDAKVAWEFGPGFGRSDLPVAAGAAEVRFGVVSGALAFDRLEDHPVQLTTEEDAAAT